MKFKKSDLKLILWILKTQISWGDEGVFGDGDEITKVKEFKRAKSLVDIIEYYIQNR